VSGELSQAILDALTDVEMPRRLPTRSADEILRIGGIDIGVHRCEALVLGSGAAGLRAAVELKRRGVDVMVATQNVFGGTSACSGSDKQTLHAASGSGRSDDFNALADAHSARAGRWTRTSPMSKQSGRHAPSPRSNSSAFPCPKTGSARFCAIRPTMTRPAVRRVAARGPRA